jgi:hypothetical protein
MSAEHRAMAVLRNYGIISGIFIGFGACVAVVSRIVNDEAQAYVISVAILGVTYLVLRASKADPSKGFFPYCLMFLVCTAVFPISDIYPTSYSWLALYAAFGGMILIALALVWRSATHT